MTFELKTMTPCKLNNANSRMEKHGPEQLVPAIDISFSIEAPNSILNAFDPWLLTALYCNKADADDMIQPDLEGVESVSEMPNLRFNNLQYPIKWDKELAGYMLTIDYGLGDESNLVLETCKVNNFQIDPKEGGTVALKFRVQCDDSLNERLLGKLAILIQHEVSITLMAPEVKKEEPMANPFPIDGGADPVENPFMTPEEALANSVSVH